MLIGPVMPNGKFVAVIDAATSVAEKAMSRQHIVPQPKSVMVIL
jgi:hypothetical protein